MRAPALAHAHTQVSLEAGHSDEESLDDDDEDDDGEEDDDVEDEHEDSDCVGALHQSDVSNGVFNVVLPTGVSCGIFSVPLPPPSGVSSGIFSVPLPPPSGGSLRQSDVSSGVFNVVLPPSAVGTAPAQKAKPTHNGHEQRSRAKGVLDASDRVLAGRKRKASASARTVVRYTMTFPLEAPAGAKSTQVRKRFPPWSGDASVDAPRYKWKIQRSQYVTWHHHISAADDAGARAADSALAAYRDPFAPYGPLHGVAGMPPAVEAEWRQLAPRKDAGALFATFGSDALYSAAAVGTPMVARNQHPVEAVATQPSGAREAESGLPPWLKES